jgi:TRAP-type C4-dicarboxylate transport system permease small subunit
MEADRTNLQHTLGRFVAFSVHLNRWVERICALLLAAMVLIVWFGVLSRYVLHLGETWSEELARYVMIWVALLAISAGAHRREHIGVEFLFLRLPPTVRRALRFAVDGAGLVFFVFMAVFGVGMAATGAHQYANIFGMTMLLPFAAVPVAATLTAVQILAVLARDLVAGPGIPPGRELEGVA